MSLNFAPIVIIQNFNNKYFALVSENQGTKSSFSFGHGILGRKDKRVQNSCLAYGRRGE